MTKQNAAAVYLILSAVSSFMFATVFTTSAVYQFQMAGLNPFQLVLVGTALEISAFTFEIPTGVVADIVSRRLSIIIGYALIGAGLFFEGVFPLFGPILLAQVIWGLGYTFTSGATDAWLAGELGEERLPKLYLRASQLRHLAGFLGIFSGVGLAGVSLQLPYWVGGGGMMAMAVWLRLAMPETNFKPAPREERNTWQHMAHTFTGGLRAIRRRSLLVTILGISLIQGLYSEGLDRLWQAHLLDNFDFPAIGRLDDIYWFGIIQGVIVLVTLGVTEALRRRIDRWGHRRVVYVLMFFDAVLIGGLVVYGLAGSFGIAAAALTGLSVARSASEPIFAAWVNRGIDPQVRATVLSTISQMNAVGQMVGGPPLGAIGTRFGLRAMFVVMSFLLSPVLALYWRARGQGGYRDAPLEGRPAQSV